MAKPTETVELLKRLRAGDRDAFERLYARVYDDLRAIARRKLAQEHDRKGLSTTVLVHEAFLRFNATDQLDVKNQAHFKAVVAQAMRRVLWDVARRIRAEKRGGNAPHFSFQDELHLGRPVHTVEEIINLHLSLERLGKLDERKANVVTCRFFAEMEYEEIAEALNISVSTVQRDWNAARALLSRWFNEGTSAA